MTGAWRVLFLYANCRRDEGRWARSWEARVPGATVVMDSGGGGNAGLAGGAAGGGKATGKSPPRWPRRSGFPGRGRTGIRRWSPPGRELAPTRSAAVENLQQLGGFDPCTS